MMNINEAVPFASGKRLIVRWRFNTGTNDIAARYYIAIGYPGFNSTANNRNGYSTAEGALAASLRYERKRKAK